MCVKFQQISCSWETHSSPSDTDNQVQSRSNLAWTSFQQVILINWPLSCMEKGQHWLFSGADLSFTVTTTYICLHNHQSFPRNVSARYHSAAVAKKEKKMEGGIKGEIPVRPSSCQSSKNLGASLKLLLSFQQPPVSPGCDSSAALQSGRCWTAQSAAITSTSECLMEPVSSSSSCFPLSFFHSNNNHWFLNAFFFFAATLNLYSFQQKKGSKGMQENQIN